MNKAIIFDMDGVIIDSETVYAEIEWQIYQEYHVPMTREGAMQSMGRGLLNWWEEIVDRYDMPISAQQAAEEVSKRYMSFLTDPNIKKEAMPGARQLMQRIKEEKNWRIAIASSSDANAISAVMDIFDLHPYIDFTISGNEIVDSKPHPEIFEKVAKHFNYAPQQCLVIEDSQSGILAAKAASMYCAAYKSAPKGLVDYSLADFAYDNHHKVLPMIEKVLE